MTASGASRRWTRCWRAAADSADDAGGRACGTRRISTERWRCIKALKHKPEAKKKLFLVVGPWHHGQEIEEASVAGGGASSVAIQGFISARRF